MARDTTPGVNRKWATDSSSSTTRDSGTALTYWNGDAAATDGHSVHSTTPGVAEQRDATLAPGDHVTKYNATTVAAAGVAARRNVTATNDTWLLHSDGSLAEDTGGASTSAAGTTVGPQSGSQETQEEQQAEQLLNQTQAAARLNSSQVEQLTGRLEKLLEGPSVSPSVGQRAVAVVSKLMEGDSLALSASASRLIRAVDDLAVKLLVTADVEVVSSESLVLAVKKVRGTDFTPTFVYILDMDRIQFRSSSRSRSRSGGSSLGSVFLPSSLTAGLSAQQQQQADRLQVTYYSKPALFQDATLNNQTLVSPVLGCSAANLSISNLTKNVQFTVRDLRPKPINVTPSCVFWDFSLNGGGGGWSSAGCFLINTTAEDTTCSCNHLTSFAILLDLSRDNQSDPQQMLILSFITYIGCGISAVFLSVTLLTYLSFEMLLRDIPAKILLQLCSSLLLLNLVFLLDGWLARYPLPPLCVSTAVFLHYFLLTSFTWSGLEALHMYLSIVQVFTPYLGRYMLKFSLAGWGIPLAVVLIVLSVDKDSYGLVTYGGTSGATADKFCWLRNDVAFYVAVVAYFGLIFALSLLVFVMVMVQLARIKRQNPQNRSPNRGVLTDLRSIVGLLVLLGLSWGFALLAWGPLHTAFVYLFTISNSLQGFLVFVFHCAVKENVRRQWRSRLCCGRLRLAEHSEWSGTAPRHHRRSATVAAAPSASTLASRSSSVISDATSSSSGSNDVILNEIHRQRLRL
ncbi:adhesion G-protein coupled receptor G2-like [Nelusetta ayraudi]|uniref:adhesion G-protein coupled receptor G2-like n=1 Tax=Nelusetta ayraudi TaxID=303726 RepID=UPI003F6FD0F7